MKNKMNGSILIILGAGCYAAVIFIAITTTSYIFVFPAIASGYLVTEGFRFINE